MRGWHLAVALTTRARVAIAQGEPEQADRDAHDALACAADVEAHLGVPDICRVPRHAGRRTPTVTAKRRDYSARREALRQRMGAVRFKIYDAELRSLGRGAS